MRRLFAALLLLLPIAAAAQGFTLSQRAEIVQILREALKADPSILRDAVTALQADEERQGKSAANAEIERLGPQLTGDPADPVAGNPKGELTIVEFYDVRCPYCRRMVPTMAKLLKEDPSIRLVYKDIPILGPASVLGAKALIAAQKQNAYLKLHDAVMSGPPTLDTDFIRTAATRLGLDWARLERDMNSAETQGRIDANLALARRLQIQGTPAYVIGNQLLPGAMDLDMLRDAVSLARK